MWVYRPRTSRALTASGANREMNLHSPVTKGKNINQTIILDAEKVRIKLDNIIQNEDLSRYIL